MPLSLYCAMPCRKLRRALPFGATVAAQVLGHRDVKFPESRSMTGRLLYWDHLRDQVSYILCPPDTPDGDATVYRAGLPVRLPPGTNVDDMAPQEPLPPITKKKFERPLADHDHSQDPHLPRLNQLILRRMMPKKHFQD